MVNKTINKTINKTSSSYLVSLCSMLLMVRVPGQRAGSGCQIFFFFEGGTTRDRSYPLAVRVLVSSSPYWTYLTTFWFLENMIACVRGCVTTSNLINLINHALTVITQQVQSLRSKTKLTLTNLATLVNHFNTCFIKLNLKRHRNLF